jgi:long-chain acyl-CoA synthetase
LPLPEILTLASQKHPQNPAIAYLNREITYQELNELSERFASALAELGVKQGDCVALFLPNIPQFVIAYYGILKAGAVVTAVSPLHREREVEHQLADSEAKVVVALDSLFPIIERIWEKTRLEHAVVTSLDEYSKAETEPQKNKTTPNVYRFQELLNTTAPAPKIAITPAEDLAALQYTGGTTGTPKAAMLTHQNLLANATAFATWIRGREAQETFLTALPLFHIYGMTTSLNVPVCLAAKMVMLPRFDPAAALAAIQAHRVTVFCGVPTMYQTLTASADLGKYDLASVRVCISGASPLPPKVQQKFMQVTGELLAEGYGLTEASPVTHCSPVDPTLRTVKVGSIGLPLPGTDARIVDLETRKVLGVGETGELEVRGPQVMKGYWRCPDETALVLYDGWLLTGDIAHMDADGYFYITDRKKDLIKYKDYSVYPRELEDVLYEHPAVKLCAVVGKSVQGVGEVPKAFVVLKEGEVASAEDLAAFVNGKMAPYKAIREVEFRKELPLSSAGKVLRRALRDEEIQRTRR